jgi:hypothetical protein
MSASRIRELAKLFLDCLRWTSRPINYPKQDHSLHKGRLLPTCKLPTEDARQFEAEACVNKMENVFIFDPCQYIHTAYKTNGSKNEQCHRSHTTNTNYSGSPCWTCCERVWPRFQATGYSHGYVVSTLIDGQIFPRVLASWLGLHGY